MPKIGKKKKEKAGRETRRSSTKKKEKHHKLATKEFIEYLLYAWHFTQSIYKLDELIFISYLNDLTCIFQRTKLKLSEVKKLTQSHTAKQW